MTTTLRATECYAQPESETLIDMIHPITGLTLCYGETLEQVRERYPQAERMTYEAWCAAKAARQDSPLTWQEITEERYEYAFEVLPPAAYSQYGFLLGEPQDHHAGNGQPRYSAYRHINGRYEESSRPVTIAEFKHLTQ